jgi:hypothetical protein
VSLGIFYDWARESCTLQFVFESSVDAQVCDDVVEYTSDCCGRSICAGHSVRSHLLVSAS